MGEEILPSSLGPGEIRCALLLKTYLPKLCPPGYSQDRKHRFGRTVAQAYFTGR